MHLQHMCYTVQVLYAHTLHRREARGHAYPEGAVGGPHGRRLPPWGQRARLLERLLHLSAVSQAPGSLRLQLSERSAADGSHQQHNSCGGQPPDNAPVPSGRLELDRQYLVHFTYTQHIHTVDVCVRYTHYKCVTRRRYGRGDRGGYSSRRYERH